jgi:hypothetical protein
VKRRASYPLGSDEELGPVAGTNECNAHASHHFITQRLGESGQRELARAVRAHPRKAHQSGDRRNIPIVPLRFASMRGSTACVQ